MAARLRHAGFDLDQYAHRGPLSFVRDYIVLSQAAPAGDMPRFGQAFEQAMLTLAASWDRTGAVAWPAQASSVMQISTQLETAFRGELAYPDFVAELGELAQASSERGDSAQALAAARLAVALYPLSDRAQALHGILLMSAGDSGASIAALRLALAIDSQGAASATALNNASYRLKASGAVAAGTALLQAAIQLHPRVANLQDTLGSFYVEQGLRAQAVQAYQQALRLDPAYANAAGARAAIVSLSVTP
jgi:tetratricopeptide (TPR) repeat protein